MKKGILIAISLLTSAVFAEDSYLYWMVDPNAKVGEESIAGSYAKVGVMQDNSGENVSYLTLYTSDGVDMGQFVDVNSLNGQGLFAYIGSDYLASGYSYYVELANDQGFLGRTGTISYDTAKSSGMLADLTSTESMTSIMEKSAAGQVWSMNSPLTPTPIPEPNSAVLMLLGFAALGLKRKRKAA